MSDKSISVSVDFWWIALAILVVTCTGSPDIVDGIVYKLTGVKIWECPSYDCESVK